MLQQATDAYQKTKKPKDIFWNRYVARPLASLLIVAPLARTRVTPNQVTFISLLVFLAAAAVMVTRPGHANLVLAVVILEISYLFDCADGQLARLRGTSSPIGAHLDFLMDELKAFVLVAATGVRLWQGSGQTMFLIEALVGLATVSSAISLTTFIRRPEYIAATGARPPASAGDYGAGFEAPVAPPTRRSPISLAIAGVERIGKFLIHYPSYLVVVAIFDRLDLFLHVYVAINAAYGARTMLGVARKLGKPERKTP